MGAQAYWAYCMACHGDRGQGLTVEFRELYPAEDRNCWDSGCHGPRPYENGFTLPASIPPLVGGDLERWGSAAGLQAFIAAAMPFSSPGSLTEEETWQVTAFLLRENGLDPGTDVLGPENAADFRLPPDANRSPSPASSSSTPTPALEGRPGDPRAVPGLVVAAGLALMIAWWVRFERRRRDGSHNE